MKKSKNILIIMLIVIEIVATYFMYKSSTNKEVVLDNVELKELKDSNSFAIYLDGTEYKDSATWPQNAMFEKAECQNEKGEIVNNVLTFNEKENKAYINNTTQTTYCYLYFSSPPSLGQFCNDQANMKECMNNKKNTIGKVENITEKETGGMYRYIGNSSNSINNWICFGTTKKCGTSDQDLKDYMYRIIGITSEGELALIKFRFLYENSTSEFMWNNYNYTTSDCESNGSKCTWPLSKLFNRLNGLCYPNNSNCTGTGSGNKGQTNIFINSDEYEYLKSESTWESIINTHNWKYGDISTLSDASTMYSTENGFQNSIDAKIGLMYIHDYLYSNGWLNPHSDGYNNGLAEWFITRCNKHSEFLGWRRESSIGQYKCDTSYMSRVSVRPVFYLNSNIKISNSKGSIEDPFIIDISGNATAP